MKVDVHDNIKAVLARMEKQKQEVIDKAIVRALNRCAEMARADAARELRAAGYNLKASAIKAAISITRAATGRLKATISVRRRAIPLIEYQARQAKKGVSVKVKGSRKIIDGAFIATMPTGHKGVYVLKPGARHKRIAGKDGRPRYSQLPIRELYGPSIGGAYSTQQVQAAMAKAIAQNFKQRFAQELKFLSR